MYLTGYESRPRTTGGPRWITPTVQSWLDRYVDAWRTYDAQAIGDLFTDDAEYRYHPWDAPVEGREAIVKDWLDDPDEPGTWDARYAPYVVDGDKAVATGVSEYDEDRPAIASTTTRSCWSSTPDGRGRQFTEIFAKRPR